jgi:dihydropteroate synthase
VGPVIEALGGELDVPISIDTYKPAVAAECLTLGATIVNDITGLEDPEMLGVAARGGAGVVIMHMRGRPKTMQQDTHYGDLLGEIGGFLTERALRARGAGIEDITIDPGIGFGKTAAQNFELIRRLGELTSTGFPVLVGPSRKSFLGSLPSSLPPEARLEGTLAAVAVSVMNGASIVRVHDVAEAKRVVEVVDAIRSA